MAAIFYGGAMSPRKCDRADAHNSLDTIRNTMDLSAPAARAHTAAPARSCGFAHATPGVQAVLLRVADRAGGVVELNELVCAIADHPRPLAAILEPVDAGQSEVDTTAPFDGALRLRRTTH